MPFELDYKRCIHLDAECLAESGIREGYESVLAELRKYVSLTAAVEEVLDNDTPSYSVRCGPKEYLIDSPELENENGELWGRAAFALFSIVNDQLAGSECRFYAIGGGNDLDGIFLTPSDAMAARDSLPNPRDWPYLLTDEPPWFGQHH